MNEHKYGPKGHIVDAFVNHLRKMSKEEWDIILAAEPVSNVNGTRVNIWDVWVAIWNAAKDAAGNDVVLYAAGEVILCAWAAWDAVMGVPRDFAAEIAADFAGTTTWDATCEILAADLLRERGKPFFFLPMFGFADENEIIN